ncbi:PAS-domain containing protein [Roseovarius sp. EL26]|uniref:PAS-domain containing protein n=1 Tax=Roseovarius sp. EL26 TaxID=2126672 RepID=UPI0020B147C1|nr:PAS-domain containing protein [Roseovarius sp. EL26]
MSVWVYIGVGVAAGILSLVVISIAAWLFSSQAAPDGPQSNHTTSRFLFHADQLIDHNLNDLDSPHTVKPTLQTWQDFRNWTAGRFGTLPETLAHHAPQNVKIFDENDGSATLEIRYKNCNHLVILSDASELSPVGKHQLLRNSRARMAEQGTLESAPCAILQINPQDGQRQESALWQQFTNDQKDILDRDITEMLEQNITQPRQIALNQASGTRWVELMVHETEDLRSCYATDISELVEAKNAQRAFLQTLTKTFANLSTGLCIFDRDHQLVLFNPALVNLTHLPIDFLSARPNLMSFFDKLRDLQMMPEPKNYAAWRIQINQMITSAVGGNYDETWPLPNGLTYRITGRPHPDGAVAFLFDDITDDVVLTRRFRTQIDIRQTTLDSLEDAIAVFSPAKTLLFCNAALARLIGFDPDQGITEISVIDLIERCAIGSTELQSWNEIEKQLSTPTHQIAFSKIIQGKSGPRWQCHIAPLAGNLLMLRICKPDIKKLVKTQPEIA